MWFGGEFLLLFAFWLRHCIIKFVWVSGCDDDLDRNVELPLCSSGRSITDTSACCQNNPAVGCRSFPPDAQGCQVSAQIRAWGAWDDVPTIRRNTLTSVQRAWMTGANASVYGYCNRVFRKLVDLLIAVLRQLRLRPAYNDAMYKTYKYILEYGAVLSDFIREPTGPDDPTWDDISRSVELMSLVNHHCKLQYHFAHNLQWCKESMFREGRWFYPFV